MRIKLGFLIIIVFLFINCKSKGEHPKENKIESQRSYLGILYIESQYGIQIAEVFPNSPAEKANLEIGDIIISANGYPVIGPYTLKERILSLKPGTKVRLEVEKITGKKIYVEAILEPLPEKYQKIFKDRTY